MEPPFARMLVCGWLGSGSLSFGSGGLNRLVGTVRAGRVMQSGDVGMRSAHDRELAPAELAEAGEHVAAFRPDHCHRVVTEAVQAVGKAPHGIAVIAVVFRAAGEQFLAEPLQRGFELRITGEVQGPEALDEGREPVECPLVDAALAAVNGRQDVRGEPGGRCHTLPDEAVQIALEALTRILRNPTPLVGNLHLLHRLGDFQPQALGSRDLEHPGIEREALGDVRRGRKGLLDGEEKPLCASVQMPGRFTPFLHRLVPQRRVAGHEVKGRLAELVAKLVESSGKGGKAGIGNETGDPSEKGKARSFHEGMGTGFDQRECGQGLARDEPLVAELDQSFADLGRIQTEVFGIETLAAPPVADAGRDEDTPAADGVEERQVILLGHDVDWLVGFVVGLKMKHPPDHEDQAGDGCWGLWSDDCLSGSGRVARRQR
jgi:hypothetical protein